MRRVGTDALPASESATSVFVWRGRSMRSCVFASFPLGAGGSRPRVDGAPRPPGSVLSDSTVEWPDREQSTLGVGQPDSA